MATGSRRASTWSTEVLHEARGVSGHAWEIDELAGRLGEEITNAAAWTFPSLLGAPSSAWAVLVRDPDGALAATAMFVDERRDDRYVTTLAGSEGGLRIAPLVASDQAGNLLCRTVADELLRRQVHLDLGPVPVDEPLVRGLADLLPGCELRADEPVPYLRRDHGTDLEDYLSHGMRRNLRKAANRLAADGVVARIEYLGDSHTVAPLLPAMQRTYQERDHGGGRTSLVDSPVGQEIWRRRVTGLLDSGQGEVAVLHLDDVFAAYVLGLRNGCWYAIAEGRFRTEYARYAPGRVLEATVISRALQASSLRGVDWLSGVAPETLLAANGSEPTVRLTGSSVVGTLPQSFRLPRQRPAASTSVLGDPRPDGAIAPAP